MLLAAGLTPAWQQILRFERLQPGEVNRAAEAVWCASGKVLNVGRAAHLLGASTTTLSPIGGLPGEAIARDFAEDGLAARWVQSERPTRCCTTLIDSSTGTITELVENAASLEPAVLEEFVAVFRQEGANATFVVLSGSLPAGTPTTIYRDLLDGCRAPALLDARGPELLAALVHRPVLVKPNREELSATVGRPLPDDASLHAAMRELLDRGAQGVLVSQGAGPAWLATAAGLERYDPLPVAPVVNPIGCGDCLAAGIAGSLFRGQPLAEAVHYGLAAAAENAATLLPARLDRERVAVRAERV
jgi:1-phosphofructokinase family hexose kinase